MAAIGANLERTSTRAAFIHLLRGTAQGVTDEPTRARMRLIVPHVMRAVAVALSG